MRFSDFLIALGFCMAVGACWFGVSLYIAGVLVADLGLMVRPPL